MSAGWVLVCLVLPPAAVAAGSLLRGASETLGIALNALVPGAGLAVLGRPFLEVAVGALVSIASLLTVGGPENLGYYVPVMALGAVWASLYTRMGPLRAGARSPAADAEPASRPAPRPAPAPRPPAPREGGAEAGYSVSVRCTECGAKVEVPVLHRMARCSYCGSTHLVVGHDDVLHVAVPEKVPGPGALADVVLDHYRNVYYQDLYRKRVAPLAGGATATGPDGAMYSRPEMEAAAAAMEARISRQADAYRARLAARLEVSPKAHFWAPYWHGMGTLYEAVFGRDRRSLDKKMAFAMDTVEASAPANENLELPPMGRLSYLRRVVPAAELGGDTAALPVQRGEEVLRAAYGHLDRKQVDKSLQRIQLGTAFVPEIRGVVWRPWWVVAARTADGRTDETLLVDSATASVAAGVTVPDELPLGPFPEEAVQVGRGLGFIPLECPTCGHELAFDPAAVVHFCGSCYRTFTVRKTRKVEVPYDRAELGGGDGTDVVPFWRFDLELVTGGGRRVTDMAHLTDGIDGTLDQIGEDAPTTRDKVLVPAFRLINSRLMTNAFRRMAALSAPFQGAIEPGRFPLDEKPSPWAVSLPEAEARRLLPLYLASRFGLRDLARANVEDVIRGLFQTRQASPGKLTYVRLPRVLTEPFRAYVGRFEAAAITAAEGIPASPGRR